MTKSYEKTKNKGSFEKNKINLFENISNTNFFNFSTDYKIDKNWKKKIRE